MSSTISNSPEETPMPGFISNPALARLVALQMVDEQVNRSRRARPVRPSRAERRALRASRRAAETAETGRRTQQPAVDVPGRTVSSTG